MTDTTQSAQQASADAQRFKSRLEHGKDRFLAHAIEHALESGRRTPEDFIRHFPPEAIMEGLANQPRLRAGILVLTTGLKQKIAARKSWQSAAEDLQIALDEGETDCESIVGVFRPDDRVRFLEAKKIWKFLVEGDFWDVAPSEQDKHRISKEHIAFMLERALMDKLVTHADIVEGITVAEMAKRLPKSELGKIIEGALSKSKGGSPFTEVDLLSEMPPFVLVEYVPLPHIYANVIAEKIAQTHGYVEPTPAEPAATGASDGGDVAAAPAGGTLPPDSEDWVDVPGDGTTDEEFDDEVSGDDFGMS
ncbi:MAG: hypothetical protein R3B13_11545 [Polyangiaceae bacterium]